MGHFIKELSYEELKPLLTEKAVVVLPIGGGSKEHGRHLPMGTDLFVTDKVAERVTRRCDVLTLPTLPYAYFPSFVRWEGSVSVDYRHFIDFVRDILESFARWGVKKFLIIDGGVSTTAPLRIMAQEMNNDLDVKVAVSDITKLARETEDEVLRQKKGGHGDEGETSIMLHIREDLVHMDKATEEYSETLPGCIENGNLKVYLPNRMCTENGTNGNSKLATKEKGERILDSMVDSLCRFLREYIAWEAGDIK